MMTPEPLPYWLFCRFVTVYKVKYDNAVFYFYLTVFKTAVRDKSR